MLLRVAASCRAGRALSALSACAILAVAIPAPAASPAEAGAVRVPTLEEQYRSAGVEKGTALGRLIAENQDFEVLSPRDRSRATVVPAWLRVWWKKAHPEAQYSDSDPTGGYPHVLKEIHEWMLSHPDLKPGIPEATRPPGWDRQSDEVERELDGRSASPRASAGMETRATTIGTNLRASGAQAASRSESDIRVNYWNPSYVISASNNISASGFQAQFWSTDGGTTWGQTTLPNSMGDASNSDPTVDWSSDGTAWSTTLGISGSTLKFRVYKSTDRGATWTYDATPSGTQTNVDKQQVWIDHSATSATRDNVYGIWHNGNPVYMNRRGAAGWLASPVLVSGTETTGTGIGSDVKTNSSGDVFGFWPDTGSRGIYVVKSTNGGTSYGTPVKLTTTYDSYDIGVPAFSSRRILLYVTGGAYKAGTKDNVYAVWTDLSGETGCTAAASEPGTSATSACKTRIWFGRSTNGGTTWLAPVKLNAQASKNDQFNPWLVVDETSGRLAVMYYDTVNDTTRKKTDVFYQTSTDDGATWSAATKVTSAMTDETVTGADTGNQYGDYNGFSGNNALFFPSWTDRRSGGKEEIWTAKITEGTPVPTYSVSGNAGAVGVLVSAGAASATSDTTSAFSIAGLAAGTYTVTPSKSGCNFSPASSSVTISAANVTGVNFTASCTAVTYSISGNAGTASATVTAGASSATADAAGAFSIASLAAGAYTVTPSKPGCTFSPASSSITISAANVSGVNFTASCPTGDIALTSGVTLAGQSVAASAWKYYTIDVPSGATSLVMATSAATGDVDIYTQSGGVRPTSTAYVCRPYTGSGNESCTATNPAAGRWYLGVYGYAAGSYSVTATVTSSTPTWSVSGSAGTSGATVTAGTRSATSDAANAFTIAGLANGTYAVTPTKSGCTFAPASASVTVSSANLTGVNFTASCTGAATLFTDGFEAAGWSTAQVSGTAGAWTYPASGTHPAVAPHGGTKLAAFNSYTAASGNQTRVYRGAGFAVASTFTTVTLKFWMYHDTGYTTSADKVQVQVSTNGTTWTNVGTAVNRYSGSTGWAQATIDLSAYKGQTVQLGFLGVSAYGNDVYLDDVLVTGQ